MQSSSLSRLGHSILEYEIRREAHRGDRQQVISRIVLFGIVVLAFMMLQTGGSVDASPYAAINTPTTAAHPHANGYTDGYANAIIDFDANSDSIGYGDTDKSFVRVLRHSDIRPRGNRGGEPHSPVKSHVQHVRFWQTIRFELDKHSCWIDGCVDQQ